MPTSNIDDLIPDLSDYPEYRLRLENIDLICGFANIPEYFMPIFVQKPTWKQRVKWFINDMRILFFDTVEYLFWYALYMTQVIVSIVIIKYFIF